MYLLKEFEFEASEIAKIVSGKLIVKNIKQYFSSKIMGLYLVELCVIHICKLSALKI